MATIAIRPIRVQGNIAYVTLTRGYESVIDAADVPLVQDMNWQAFVRPAMSGGFLPIYAAGVTLLKNGPRKRLLLHKVILPVPDGMVVDHINGDGLDNRRCNLRPATHSQNSRNKRPRKDGAAIGVYQEVSGKWTIGWKMGGFATYQDAAEARHRLRVAMEGEDYPRRDVQLSQPLLYKCDDGASPP